MKDKESSKKVKGYDVEKELLKINNLFADLAKDKTLPTFVEFFMQCLILGVAERVNLKKMYPKTYTKLNGILEKHDAQIRAMRRLQIQEK